MLFKKSFKDFGFFLSVRNEIVDLAVIFISKHYDGPNGSLFISILLHNSEFRILNSEFRNLHCEFRNSNL